MGNMSKAVDVRAQTNIWPNIWGAIAMRSLALKKEIIQRVSDHLSPYFISWLLCAAYIACSS